MQSAKQSPNGACWLLETRAFLGGKESKTEGELNAGFEFRVRAEGDRDVHRLLPCVEFLEGGAGLMNRRRAQDVPRRSPREAGEAGLRAAPSYPLEYWVPRREPRQSVGRARTRPQTRALGPRRARRRAWPADGAVDRRAAADARRRRGARSARRRVGDRDAGAAAAGRHAACRERRPAPACAPVHGHGARVDRGLRRHLARARGFARSLGRGLRPPRGNTETAARSRTRDLLVVGQIAATLWLVIGAALLLRSFAELRKVNPGFNADRVYSLHLSFPRSKYPKDADVAALGNRILDRVRGFPTPRPLGWSTGCRWQAARKPAALCSKGSIPRRTGSATSTTGR